MKTRIIQAAAELLAQSPDGDVSTRAVAEAAGVGVPALYRHFGDKDGLLSAVVDFGFEQYLATKRAAVPSDDPLRDLRDGWDKHLAFALANPNYYKLMYSPLPGSRPEAAAEAHRLLTEVVERVAAAGRLAVPVPTAAQMIMAANSGVALALLYRPEQNTDPELSTRMRETIIGAVTGAGTAAKDRGIGLDTAATTLNARLKQAPSEALSPVETALLREWLGRLERHEHMPDNGGTS